MGRYSFGALDIASLDFASRYASRHKGSDQAFAGHARRTAVVLAEVANVEIERYGIQFRPGMYGQMRFGQDHRTGSPGRLGLAAELMKHLPDRRQTGNRAHRQAQFAQGIDAVQRSTADKRELLAVFSSIQADLQAMATQFNQLRTDYNANGILAKDTTATAITLNTTA